MTRKMSPEFKAAVYNAIDAFGCSFPRAVSYVREAYPEIQRARTEADERAAFNTGKSASWRKRRASDKQLAFAVRLGYAVEPGMRGGEVGDMISVAMASQRIDPYVRAAQ